MSTGEGDKRKVTTDALETLGTIITEAEKRDAIHLAVEPVVAKQLLRAGDHVSAEGRLVNPKDSAAVGIVDPFLADLVQPGQRFWLVIYPRQIHSLRHVWTHPAFSDAPEVAGEAPKLHEGSRSDSETWLKKWCATHDMPGYALTIKTLEEIIDGKNPPSDEDYGTAWSFNGEYIVFHGSDAHTNEIEPEFWKHVETVLGKKVPQRLTEAEGFSCSC